jgi:cell division protein FtsL
MNGPRINDDERGFTVNKTGALVSLGVFILSVGTATVSVVTAFNRVESEVGTLKAQWEAQASDRTQYRRDVDQRLRALEQDRTTAIAELASLRRDLTEFRLEIRTDLQGISTVLQQVYRNGGGTP